MHPRKFTFSTFSGLLSLLVGIGLYTLVGWKWNVAAAAWLAPIFLIYYFRRQKRWITTVPAVLLMWAASYANKAGAWDMEPLLEVAVLGLAALPMIGALYLDRFTMRRLPGFWSTLVFPAVFVALDYPFSFLPFGTVFSVSVTQFYFQPLVQVAALTGVWGIEFLVLWAAPVINVWWEYGFTVRPVRVPLATYAICLATVLLYGGLRIVMERPTSSTVRVAGVTVAHSRDYWTEIIDRGTPEELVRRYTTEMQALEDQLFVKSEEAVKSGAQIIFWSEADGFLWPEHKAAFIERARDFARQHRVYFMPAYQVLRYGDTSGFNGLALITPQGDVAYEYEKTISWYATTSDGVLHSVDTPFGRIGSVICFDLDFPYLVRQSARQSVDILLVPAFDTYQTRVYHSEVGLLRSVEDGFSVVRMVNEGTSMAMDYRGQLLAYQDFFTTDPRILVVDLPTRGVTTLYGRLGDWFAWASVAVAVISLLSAALRPAKNQVPAAVPI